MPPPAEGFAARLVIGPALRTQPDRRLVGLVRDGYELAFEEIVRRYGKPLARYAAAIVGGRAEDVTQDAFSKALLALRRDGAEIELRPWLFRIVRNTALNELRDNPPSPEVLAEAIAGGRNPAEEIERREELTDLMLRLQSLPEPQRAAIVMRELEGLGHEEIATALGLSGGAARQAIYRARRALRDGAGLLLPLPLLKALLMGGTTAPVDAAAGAAGLGGVAGAGVALKAATATVLVAGAVGAGVAIDHSHHGGSPERANAQGVVADDSATSAGGGAPPARTAETGSSGAAGDLRGHSGPGSGSGSDRGSHRDTDDNRSVRESEPSHSTGALSEGTDDHGGDGHRGPSHSETGDDHGGNRGPSGHDDLGDGGGLSGRGPGGSSGPGSGSSGDGGGGDDHSGPGAPGDDSGSSVSSGSNSGPGSGGDGSGSGGESSDDEPVTEVSSDSHGGDGFSMQKEPQPQEEP
jgi:RNA polymerase sigma factor (sigma-70 family)